MISINSKDLITKEALERAIILTLTDIKNQNDLIQSQIDILKNAESPLFFESYSNFPILGNPNRLYIDTSSNKVYRFDNDNICYRLITGFDFENDKIDHIQCIL